LPKRTAREQLLRLQLPGFECRCNPWTQSNADYRNDVQAQNLEVVLVLHTQFFNSNAWDNLKRFLHSYIRHAVTIPHYSHSTRLFAKHLKGIVLLFKHFSHTN
jgi:hypothetical protein